MISIPEIKIRKSVVNFVLMGLIAIAVFYTFKDLPQTFFQQDEWYSFGKYLYAHSQGGFNFITDTFKYAFSAAHFNPFTRLISFFNFLIIGISFKPYAIEGIVLHCVNSILVFVFITSLTKKRLIGFIGALFFAVNSVHCQAVTWLGTFIPTQGSALFSLLSLIVFLKYLESDKRKFYHWSIILFVISLGFKESSFFLLLFLPLLDYIWREKKDRKALPFLKSHLILWTMGLVLFLSKIVPFFRVKNTSLFLGGSSSGFAPKLIYNFIFYPLKALPQIFIRPETLYNWADKLIRFKYADLAGNLAVQQGVASDYILVLLSLAILLFLFILYKFLIKEKTDKGLIIISLSFIFLSVLPYVILGQAVYLESRYYYLTSIGAGFLFGLVVFSLADFAVQFVQNKHQRLKKYAYYGMIFILVVPFLYYHANLVKKSIDNSIEVGMEKKIILNQIRNTYPVIPGKVIFYTESDKSYYGQSLTEKMLPFQNGLGWTLMVLYAADKQLSPQFFANNFLWNLLEQGYKEIDNQGFGYFRDYNKMLKAVKDNNLKPENIIALRWDKDKLYDTTDTIREKVSYGYDEDAVKRWVYGNKSEEHGNERWVYYDTNQGRGGMMEQQLIGAPEKDGYKDLLYTARTFTNAGWVGGYLTYHSRGNGAVTCVIPSKVYGYQVVHIDKITVNDNLLEYNYHKEGNGDWTVVFNQNIMPEDVIKFDLFVAVRQADISIDPIRNFYNYSKKDISGFAETVTINYLIKEDVDRLVINSKDRISAFPISSSGEGVVYIDGWPVKTESVTIDNQNNRKTLIVKFREKVKRGQLLEIPVLMEFNPR